MIATEQRIDASSQKKMFFHQVLRNLCLPGSYPLALSENLLMRSWDFLSDLIFQLRVEGDMRGAKPDSGVQRFEAPEGPQGSAPHFSNLGSRTPPSQGPGGSQRQGLPPPLRFQWTEKRRSHSPRGPLRWFQPSGSYPRGKDKVC